MTYRPKQKQFKYRKQFKHIFALVESFRTSRRQNDETTEEARVEEAAQLYLAF